MVWLKKLIKIILILAILGLLVGLAVVFFLDPNDFKNQINNSLQDYTGQHLQVKGPIQWTLRPNAKLQLKDVVLYKEPDETATIVTIKEAFIDFDALSYFSKNLVITNLELNDVTVDWDLAKSFVTAPPKHQSIINALTIRNVAIIESSQTKPLTWQLKDSILSANNLIINTTDGLAPIRLQGNLVNASNAATWQIDAMLKADATKHNIILDPLKLTWNTTAINGTATITQYENDTNITGSLALDTTDLDSILKKLYPHYSSNQAAKTISAQTIYSYQINAEVLDLTNTMLQINNGTLSGNVKASLSKPYQIEFALTADNMDFMPLKLLGSAMLPSAASNTLISMDFAKNLTINGKFTGSHLNFKDMQIAQANIAMVGQNGIFQFNPVVIAADGGTHNITLNIDVINKPQAMFQLTEQADDIKLETLLGLVQESGIIDGTASIKASLQALGNDPVALKQSLTGNINMYVNDGTLYNIDAIALMNFTTQAVGDIFAKMSKSTNADLNALAASKSSDWIKIQQDHPDTKFDYFELKADLAQGVSNKASIAMNNNSIELKATGDFNLNDDTVNFSGTLTSKVDVTTDQQFLAGYMKQTPLPLQITGSIEKPIFAPNIQQYAINIIALAQKDILNQAVSKMVAVTPPDIKTPKTASDLFLDSLQSLSR